MKPQVLAPADALAYWRKNPVEAVKTWFKVTPDDWQAECLITAFKPGRKRIARISCAGPGKSAELAWEALIFETCFGDEQDHPQGACVSINKENLRDGLWKELAKWQRVSDLHRNSFQWTSERFFLKEHPETWFISARTWPKKADPEEQGRTLSGIHSRYIWFGIDEAGSIPIQVKQAAEQALAQSDLVFGCISIAGNPTDKTGMLYRAAYTERQLWDIVISITGDPDDPKRSSRVDIEHCRKMIKVYGRNSPWVKVMILGQFPDEAINQLLSLADVERAEARHVKPSEVSWAAKILGIDVARQGLDQTVMYWRQHALVMPPLRFNIMDGSVIAAHAAQLINEQGIDATFVDDTGGYGGSVIDHLRTPLGFKPVPVQYSSAALDPRFYNRRTHNWWKMAQAIKEYLAIPDIPELRMDLITPTYSFKQDRMLLEPKEMVQVRLDGRSPNDGDSLSQTFDQDVAPKNMIPGPTDPTKERLRYNPERRMSIMDDPWSD